MISFSKAAFLIIISIIIGHYTGILVTKDNIMNDCVKNGEFTVFDKTIQCSFNTKTVPLSLPEKATGS